MPDYHTFFWALIPIVFLVIILSCFAMMLDHPVNVLCGLGAFILGISFLIVLGFGIYGQDHHQQGVDRAHENARYEDCRAKVSTSFSDPTALDYFCRDFAKGPE